MGKAKKEKKPVEGKIGIGKFWAWESREVSDAATVLILGYLALFCTDVIHIDPLIVGTVLAISKVIDAITDVLAGYIVDRTNTKWGKGRPYTFCQFGVWICIILLYSCPQSLSEVGKVAWVSIMYILSAAVFGTLLGASERVYQLRAFNEKQIIRFAACGGIATSLCGFFVAILLPQMVQNAGNSVAGWGKMALTLGIPLSLLGMVRFIFIKEKYDFKENTAEEFKLKDVFYMLKTNKHIWPFFLTSIMINISTSIGVGQYFFKHVIGNLGIMSIFAAISILALPILFVLPALMRRFTIRQIMVTANAISIVFGLIGFVFYKNIPVLMIVYVVTTMASLPGTYLVGLITLQCAEYNEYCGRRRMEGTIGSVLGFAKNVGAALGTFLAGVALKVIHYDGAAETISAGTEQGLRFLMYILPVILLAVQLICMSRYKLEDHIDEIKAANVARREKAAAADGEA